MKVVSAIQFAEILGDGASMPLDRKVRKAPVIQRAAFRYIFFSSVIFLMIGASLKNHS